MAYEHIFTNKAYAVMKKQHISKQEVLTAFHSKNLESVSIPGAKEHISANFS